MAFNIDIAIVAGFLLLILVVGIFHGRGIANIQDYALGGRNFSTSALVATIVATWIGGDYLFITMSEVYTSGLEYAIGCLGMPVCLLFNALIFAPRMSKFLGKISVAEMMGDLYGKEVRVITAISGSIAAAGFVAVQFKIFDSMLGIFFGLKGDYYIYAIAFVIVFYSAFGGIKSVAFTDIIQFFTFGILLPIMGATLWYSCIANPEFSMAKALQNPLFDFKQHLLPGGSAFWSTLTLFFMFAIPDIDPPIFQRFSIGKDVHQVKKAFLYSSIIVALILISMSWLSFLLFNISADLNPDLLVPYIVENYASHSLKILILIGIISMCMSSADSNINSASVILTHDFCNVLNIKIGSELFLSKLLSALLGTLALYFAMLDYDLLPLVFMTQSFYIPIIDVPLILAILGFTSSKRSVLIGMIASFISVIVWRIYFMDTGIDSILPGTLVNLAFFMGSHHFLKEPGGWSPNPTIENNNKSTTVKFFHNLSFSKIINTTLPKDPKVFIAFGMYSMIATICSMYSISDSDLSYEKKNSLILLYETNLLVAVSFLLFPVWPKMLSSKRFFITTIWNISLVFILILTPLFLTLFSNFNHAQFVVFILNFVVLSVLIQWKHALVIIFSSILISLSYFSLSEFDYFSIMSTKWTIFYSILLSATSIVIFIKPTQEMYAETEAKVEVLEGEVQDLDSTITALQDKEMQYQSEISSLNEAVDHYSERVADQAKEIERLGATAQKILNNVNHELRLPVGNVMNFAEMLYEGLGNYSQEQLKELTDEVYQNSTRLSTMILNMLDLATLDVKKVGLVKSTENFSELVRDRVKICRNIYLQGKPIDFKLIIEPEILISIDPNYMRQVVDNLVINAINFSEKGTVEIEVRRNDDAVVMTLRDQGKGIPREELFDIFKPFKMGSNSECQSQGRGIGLALCKSAVEAHGGSILAESPGDIGALFTIILVR